MEESRRTLVGDMRINHAKGLRMFFGQVAIQIGHQAHGALPVHALRPPDAFEIGAALLMLADPGRHAVV